MSKVCVVCRYTATDCDEACPNCGGELEITADPRAAMAAQREFDETEDEAFRYLTNASSDCSLSEKSPKPRKRASSKLVKPPRSKLTPYQLMRARKAAEAAQQAEKSRERRSAVAGCILILMAIAGCIIMFSERDETTTQSDRTIDATFRENMGAMHQRIEQLVRNRHNPEVELIAIDARRDDVYLVIRGRGRNVGECVLGGLMFWAELPDASDLAESGLNSDGIMVIADGRTTFERFEIPVGGEFSFELVFTPDRTPRRMKVWFVLNDGSDLNWDNDPIVPVRFGGDAPQEYLNLPVR